jgi:1-acyl-sn-glycerol-3-phosphate acyltransferase
MIILRSLLFTSGAVVITLLLGIISVLWLPLSYQKRYAFAQTWCYFILTWLRWACGINYRLEGLENLPQQASVVLSKHQSTWETIAYPLLLPPHSWLLKRELLSIPVFGWYLARMNPIAIDRGKPRKALQQLLTQGGDYLQQGLWVVTFPEGTRVAPGQRKNYALGGALLAEKQACPVVPIAHNAGEFWSRNSFLKYPGTIRVCIGPPIDTIGKSAKEINALAEQWIERTTELLHAGH